MQSNLEFMTANLQRDSAEPSAAARRARQWSATLRSALREWWQRNRMDDMTAYLSEATSHVDLEHRMRAWNEAERRWRMPFV